MIRKDRFGEVFFVDLPTEERREIFKIHLTRRGLGASQFTIGQLMEFTIGWTGSEIEQCVVSAVTKARLADRELTNQDLINRAPLAHDERADQSHSRLGFREGGEGVAESAAAVIGPASALRYRPATRLGAGGSHPGVPSSHWLSVSCSTCVPS